MSADNYLTIERHKGKWAVMDGCASTDWKQPRIVFATRDEAIDEAQKIQTEEIIEYGIAYIEPINKEENTMNVTHIQEYNGKSIVKSNGLYYLTDGTEASLAGAKGYDSIADLVKAQEPKSEPKTAKKSK